MKVAALILYAVAFALQMVGAFGVIHGVVTSIRNMRQLKDDLLDAEATADEHRRKSPKFEASPEAKGRNGQWSGSLIWRAKWPLTKPAPLLRSSAGRC